MESSPTPTGAGQPQAPAFESAFTLLGVSISVINRNLFTLAKLLLVPFLVIAVPILVLAAIGAALGDGNDVFWVITIILNLVFVIAGVVLSLLSQPAIMITQLFGVRHHTVGARQALQMARKHFWRYLGVMLVTAVIYIVAFMLFIVPFFFAYHRLMLAPFYVLDQGMGVSAALKRSAQDARTYSGPVWGLVGVQLLFGLLTFIPLLGAILSLLYMAAPAARYNEIRLAEMRKAAANQPTAHNPGYQAAGSLV